MSEPTDKSVVIVGAGIAGLAAGRWLESKGYTVKLYEALDRPGGRAITIFRPDDSGDRVDSGTQYYHTNYKRARALIRETGLKTKRIRGRTRFFDHRARNGTFTTGHRVPYIGAGSVMANVKIVIWGLCRLLRNPINPFSLKRNSKIDTVSAQAAVPEPFEQEFTARALVSVGALVEPVEEAGFEVSYLQLIRLMWIILMTEYLTLKDGTDALHQALAADLDVTYQAKVKRIIWDGQARGVELEDGSIQKSNHVILATPPGATSAMLPEDWTTERNFLEKIPHPPVTIVTLFLDRPLEHKVWSYIFRYNPDHLVSFCVDGAQKNPDMVPSGRGALQAWIGWPASKSAQEMDDGELVSRVVEELTIYFPGLGEQVCHHHVMHHEHAVPQCKPGHSKAACGFLDAIDNRRGLEICGDFYSGGYTESALWSAERAIARITRR